MSHVQHQVMCITSWNQELINKIHDECKMSYIDVSPIIKSMVNAYYTFFIPPSGSKEGWAHEKVHLGQLNEVERIIKLHDYEDGGNPIEYCRAVYGENEG